MKTSRTIDSKRPAARRAALNFTPIAMACATLVLPSATAYAQQAAADASQTVVVTGIRRSIETSVATKRNSDSIVEAISAEDIGKLPDTSIAEALARLPGVTAQRVDGRAQVLSIRGMGPAYSVTLLNGREVVSTGDSRSVEFDQFPSELINAATVYKTPDAALGAQGLAGTLNMMTVRPLDLRGRHVNFNVRGEVNANGAVVPGASDKGSRISASYIDQFADNTVGVALGYARLDSPNQQKYFKSWWWGNSAIWWGGFRGLENEDPNKAPSVLQGFDSGVTSTTSVRDGLMAVLEYRPNKDLRTQVDLYYSKFDQQARGREFQANLMPDWSGNGTSGAPVSGGPIYSNVGTTQLGNDPVVTSGTLSNVDPLVLIRHNDRQDKILALGWNTELGLGKWKAVADLSYSKADRDEVVGELTASATTLTGFTNFYAETGSGFSRFPPTGNYASPSVVQLRGVNDWGSLNGVAQAGSRSPIKVEDDLKGLRLSAKRDLDFSILSSFEGGLNHTDRSKDVKRSQTIFALKNGVPCVSGDNNCAPIPAGILQSPADLSFVGVPGVVSFDMMDAVASGVYNEGVTNAASAPGRIWGVKEKVTTLFGKLGLDFKAGIPVRGNVGVQVVRADQSATGLAWDPSTQSSVPMTGGASYTDVLPSLNLVGEVTPTMLVRFGAAKVMARPTMEQMRAGFSNITVSDDESQKPGQWSANGGNPGLEPWRATAFDLSVEKYFGKRSYVAAAAFHKKLASSIYVSEIDYDFTGFPNPTNNVPTSNIGRLSAPTNGQGGYVKGIELSAALEGGLATPALDGFGLLASYSNTKSNVAGANGNGEIDLKRPLEGLSGKVTSLVAYYEKYGFQARIGQRYRSKFQAEIRGVWIERSLAAIEAERITDLQLGYGFESGMLKGLSVLLQVNNLTDTPYRTSLQDDSSRNTPMNMMPERYYRYGRQYLLGVNYKL